MDINLFLGHWKDSYRHKRKSEKMEDCKIRKYGENTEEFMRNSEDNMEEWKLGKYGENVFGPIKEKKRIKVRYF